MAIYIAIFISEVRDKLEVLLLNLLVVLAQPGSNRLTESLSKFQHLHLEDEHYLSLTSEYDQQQRNEWQMFFTADILQQLVLCEQLTFIKQVLLQEYAVLFTCLDLLKLYQYLIISQCNQIHRVT
ncbi:UNKNOWN [Stylonychia lemnae]|uniref:Uncharacterized protein n=1 Tax=Stylonychia lemnae TaxID=5949 RepID=A0A078BCP9_STYLE|nr:UNKNOWN [Stylonychia lemnae]|eukprot:CDW90987.1 UNKNOWN [Stylonychia lemnae]